jgi:hypothetical protein
VFVGDAHLDADAIEVGAAWVLSLKPRVVDFRLRDLSGGLFRLLVIFIEERLHGRPDAGICIVE